MARECTGSLFENPPGSGRWHGKFTTPVGRRSIHLVTCRTREEAEARKHFIVEQLARLRDANRLEFVRKLLELAARAPVDRLDRVRRGVDAIVAGDFERPPMPGDVPDGGPTFQEFAEEWTSGKLHQRFPDHVGSKSSVGDDIYRLKAHVYPVVGGIPLRQFTTEQAEFVMASLPARSSGTRRQVAQLLSRVLKLAAYPARIIERSPLPPGFLPKPGPSKALAWLYPEEESRLLAKCEVPIFYRVLYGFLAREGVRKSEALKMTWSDLDLERGVITLDENKSKDPRAWAADSAVVRALRWWKDNNPHRMKPDDRIFIDGRASKRRKHLAETFRGHLGTVEGRVKGSGWG